MLDVCERGLAQDGKMHIFEYFNRKKFFGDTLSNMVISYAAVEQNRPFIIDYLTKLGFGDIKIEFKTSPHNNRKNYWIVSATKQ